MFMDFVTHLILSVTCNWGSFLTFKTTKYMETGRHEGMVTNQHIRIGSNSYEKVKTFKYLGSLLTNQNSVQEE